MIQSFLEEKYGLYANRENTKAVQTEDQTMREPRLHGTSVSEKEN